MFQNAAIDVAIGLILMYLMLSLLCTTVNEYIATKLKLRSDTLASAIKKLLDDPTLYNAFYKHGLIVGNAHATATGAQTTATAVASGATAAANSLKGLVTTAPAAGQPAAPAAGQPAKIDAVQNHPSYLSGKTVALALIGSLDKTKPIPGFADLKAAVENNLKQDSAIRDALLSSLTEAQGDLDKLRTSIATWFDDSMERLSGAYKRKLKWISVLIGLLVAIAFNADSFKVATSLWNDSALRASVVQVATDAAKRPAPTSGQSVNDEELKKQVTSTENALRSLPIGWPCKPNETWWECISAKPESISLAQVLGWLLTAAALSLGAPFWFDLLNKFINLRGAGSKPAREDSKSR